MGLLAAYMVPHPPMIVPEVGRGGEKQVPETVRAYRQVAGEIAELRPETILLFSPHATMYADWFHISPGKGAAGDLGAFRAPQVKFSEAYDEELRDRICAAAKKEGFPGFRIHCCKFRGCGISMGNGGFSLRRTDACRRLIRMYRWRKCYWFWKRNEDIFFGVLGMDDRNAFRLADTECGKSFALEYGLRESMEEGHMPYAVHGWKKEIKSYSEMRSFLAGYGIYI